MKCVLLFDLVGYNVFTSVFTFTQLKTGQIDGMYTVTVKNRQNCRFINGRVKAASKHVPQNIHFISELVALPQVWDVCLIMSIHCEKQ